MSDVQVTFSLSKDDFVRAGRAIMLQRRWVRPFLGLMGLCAFLFVASNVFARGGPRVGRLALELFAIALALGLFWFAPWLHVNQNLRNHTQAFKPQSWSFGPSGVTVETPASRGSFEWPVVVRVQEDVHFLLLYVSDAIAYPVPKAALSPDQLAQLRQGLRLWLGDRAQLTA